MPMDFFTGLLSNPSRFKLRTSTISSAIVFSAIMLPVPAVAAPPAFKVVPANASAVMYVPKVATVMDRAYNFINKLDPGVAQALSTKSPTTPFPVLDAKTWTKAGLDINRPLISYSYNRGRRSVWHAFLPLKDWARFELFLKTGKNNFQLKEFKNRTWGVRSPGEKKTRYLRIFDRWVVLGESRFLLWKVKLDHSADFGANPSYTELSGRINDAQIQVYINAKTIDEGLDSVIGNMMPRTRVMGTYNQLYRAVAFGIWLKDKSIRGRSFARLNTGTYSHQDMKAWQGRGVPKIANKFPKNAWGYFFLNLNIQEAIRQYLKQDPQTKKEFEMMLNEDAMARYLFENSSGKSVVALYNLDRSGGKADILLSGGMKTEASAKQFLQMVDKRFRKESGSKKRWSKKGGIYRLQLGPANAVYLKTYKKHVIIGTNRRKVANFGNGGGLSQVKQFDGSASFGIYVHLYKTALKMQSQMPLEMQVLLSPLLKLKAMRLEAAQEGDLATFDFELKLQ